jgi:hypothetical protein
MKHTLKNVVIVVSISMMLVSLPPLLYLGIDSWTQESRMESNQQSQQWADEQIVIDEQEQVRQNLGPDFTLVVQNGGRQFVRTNSGQRDGGYDSYFVRDGQVWGRIGTSEELVVDSGGRVNQWGGYYALERQNARP